MEKTFEMDQRRWAINFEEIMSRNNVQVICSFRTSVHPDLVMGTCCTVRIIQCGPRRFVCFRSILAVTLVGSPARIEEQSLHIAVWGLEYS